MSCSTPDFHVSLFALNSVGECHPWWRGWETFESLDGLKLRRDIPLVAQLVLPLVVGLLYVGRPYERHVWIQPDPQYWRVRTEKKNTATNDTSFYTNCCFNELSTSENW